jgi:heat shock protein 5
LVSYCDPADPEDYKEKLKEVEDVCNPIIAQVYKSGGGPGGDDEDLGDHDEL